MPTSARQSVPLFAKIFGEFAAVKQADDSVRPQNARLFSEILGEFVTSQRADVGIGPYRVLRKFADAHRAEQICQAPTGVYRKREIGIYSGGYHVHLFRS